jgi:hypothetical protein
MIFKISGAFLAQVAHWRTLEQVLQLRVLQEVLAANYTNN